MPASYQKAFHAALRLLTRRDHSMAELNRKLRQRGVEKDVIQAVLAECRRLNYLDDDRFAAGLISRLKRKGCGSLRMRTEFHRHGLAGGDGQKLLNEAFANRPELKISRENVESKELSLHVARNNMLPGLDLNLSYWSPGVSGDRLIYLHDNPFLGIIVGKEKGNGTDSLRDAMKMLYKNWSVSLTVSFPLSNILTRAEHQLARMEKEKSLLELKNLERQVALEVKDALRDIETNAKRVDAYKLARDLAEKRLRAEEKKLAVGLTTNYFVLEYQEKLATSRSQEILSLIDYRLALARLEKAVGSSIQHE